MAEILYESNYYGVSSLGDSLEHHGIKGQKWGIRRFQNPDGSLTSAGKQRYSVKMARKYHLFEEHPNSAQAWDNARYIKDAGGRHSEIKKYLRDNKFSSDEIKFWAKDNGYGRRIRDDVNDAISNAKTKREEKRAERAAAARKKAFEEGDLSWAKKNANKLTNNELNEIMNRANTMKRLDELSHPDRKSSMEKIQNAANKLSSFGNSIANAKQTYDKLQEAFKPKEKAQEKSELDKFIDTKYAESVQAAMNEARKNTKGDTKEKEFAAYMTAKNMYDGRNEAAKKAAAMDKATKEWRDENNRRDWKAAADREEAREKAKAMAGRAADALKNKKEREDSAREEQRRKKRQQEELERIRKQAGGRMWL